MDSRGGVQVLYLVSLRIIGLSALVVRYHIAYDIAFVVELVISRMDPLQIVISGVLVTYNGAAQR